MSVIRNDVVKIGIDVDDSPIKKLTDEIGKIQKALGIVGDDDSLMEVADNAKKVQKSVKDLNEESKKLGEAKGIKKFKENIDKTIKSLTGGEKGVKGFTTALKNIGKISVEKLNNSLKKVKDNVKDIGEKAGGAAFNGLKKLAGVSFKALGVGLAGAATGIGAIVKKSVDAYANFEQLEGGVSKLFGVAGKSLEEYAESVKKPVDKVKDEYTALKGAEDTLFKNANDAYKNAGISANTYMETTTSFAASLIKSCGGDTQKAAELADMAIKDMSDNANTFGFDIETMQNVYKGLAKEQYMLLDNLSLGYGGTKEGAEQLVKDAAKIDKSIKANDLSFANMVKAINVLQIDMGIYGTTANEAATTIAGSGNMVKATWENLLIALGRGEGIDQCITNMVDAVETFGSNVIPVAEKALVGIGSMVEKLAPIIAEKLPPLAEKLIPPLISAAWTMTVGLVKALPNIVGSIVTSIVDIFEDKCPAIKKVGDVLINNAKGIAVGIVGAFAAFKAFKLGKGIMSLFGGKGEGGKSNPLQNLVKSFSEMGKYKTKDVALGLANLAIIFGGITVLTGICAAIMMLIAKFADAKTMLEMVAVVGAVGLVGGALAKVGATVGKIPVSTVAKGLANMAIMVGGLTALFAILAVVSMIPFDVARVFQITAIIGVLGLMGAALSIFGAIVGLIPVPVVALGLANIAIIIAGMSALFLLIGAVSLIDFDLGKILIITNIIGVLGTLGAKLTAFAGILGLIPIPVVLAGLANIGLVLGGMAVLITAFGALCEIPGFTKFIEQGGQILVKIMTIIGEMVGALVGGALNKIASFLPTIGESIGQFGENIKPLFSSIAGVDMNGVSAFFTALIGLFAMATGEGIIDGLKSFFGIKEEESPLAKMGTQLSDFAKNAKTAFTHFSEFPEKGITNAPRIISILENLSKLKFDGGGLKSLWSGEVGLESIGTQLDSFAHSAQSAFNCFSEYPEKGMANAPKAIDIIKKACDVFGAEGVADVDIAKKGDQFDKFAHSMQSAINCISEYPSNYAESFTEVVESFKGLADLSGVKIDTSNIDTFINAMDSAKDGMKELVKQVSDLPKKMGKGIKASGNALSNALVEIWRKAVTETAKPINQLIDGANHILKQFGSSKTITKWQPNTSNYKKYAKGTDGHRGGNAMVNDGRGAELVQMPNGNTFIPRGRNVFLPNAPKGMKVLSAERTAKLFGKKSPTFRYANGVGSIDVWSFYNNASGLIDAVKKKYVNYKGSGLSEHLGEGAVNTISNAMVGWAKKLFEESGQSIGSYIPSKGVSQWIPTVTRALKMLGLYSEANVKRTLFQMQTESGGNPRAINLWDSNAKKGIPSKGLMQVIDPTFKAYAHPNFNKNIYDPLSNILASLRYATARYGSLEKAYRGVGYSGGVGTISLPDQPSSLNMSYTPESSYRGVAVTENNSYSPVFNLTINGSTNDRETERKVKRWISEAMEEVFDSMSRKNPRLREV